jgi:hypothetical protein
VIDDHRNWRLSRAFIMPSTLRNRLNELAKSFSAGVLDAIRGASLEELLSESSGERSTAPSRVPPVRSAAPSAGPTRRRSGRLPRRSAGDIAQALDAIVGLLKDNAAGLRAEQIRQKLGLQAKELPRPLKEGLDARRLSKVGRKRATTYFAGTAPSEGRKVAATASRAGGRRRGRSKKSSAKVAPKKRARVARVAPKKRRRGRAKG